MTHDAHGPPDDLDTLGRNLYHKVRGFLKDQGTWQPSDKYVLGQTCRYEMRARVARSRMVTEDGALTFEAEGYKGQLVQHPNLKTAVDAEKSFVEGLKELGLTPRARKQLEIEVGGGTDGGKFGGAFG